ncbi:protein phosphatase 2C domain-containing protein [Streptomyces sp. NPDC058157]|uniref:protein phosphatase 2C domain-containing protein n=1 Tax=Streptomyces sp. NPDC058157 TaxID=3346360 RepID=UPI0036EE4E15
MHRLSGCPSCAEPLEEGDRFCGVCGYSLSSPTPPPDRTPTLPDPGPAGGSADGVTGPAHAARVPAPAGRGFGSPAGGADPGYGVPAGGYAGAPARQEDRGFGSAAGVPAPGWEGTPATPGSVPAAPASPGDAPWGAAPYGGTDDAHHGRPGAAVPEGPYGAAARPEPQADPYPAARTDDYGAPAQTAPHEGPYGAPYGSPHEAPSDPPSGFPHEVPPAAAQQGDPHQGPYGAGDVSQSAYGATPHEGLDRGPAAGAPQGDPGQGPYGAARQGDVDQGAYDATPHASLGQGTAAGAPQGNPHEDPSASGPQGEPGQDPHAAAPQGSGGGRTCVACRAGAVDTDGYCEHCGHAQPRERDHLEEELCSVAAVSDRGLRHHRNEDSFAVAATALPDGSAATVAIVCDGVSSASRPDDASAAAAGAASEALLDALPRGAHPAEAMHEAILAAGAAVSALAPQPPGAQNAPACTLVGAVVSSGVLTVGWVGDSRAYWVPDDRAAVPRRLTEDDSWAAQMVAAGLMGEAEAYADVRAHAITGWLGADAYDLDPHTASFRPDHPGVVVVCTDGLWNYAESAVDMARILPPDAAERPLHCAQVLVGHALDGGGHDNITVAVVPFAAAPPEPEAEPEAEAEAEAEAAEASRAEPPHPLG